MSRMIRTINDRLLSIGDLHIRDNTGVYGNERACSNCQSHSECWTDVSDSGTPPNFEYRSGWDYARFLNHMKSVTGQICGNFNHINLETRALFQRADTRRELRIRQEYRENENGWDQEENQ